MYIETVLNFNNIYAYEMKYTVLKKHLFILSAHIFKKKREVILNTINRTHQDECLQLVKHSCLSSNSVFTMPSRAGVMESIQVMRSR